jgi:hypothetical protein
MAAMDEARRKMRLVTDLPIWADCPYPTSSKIEVRCGKFEDDEPEMIVLWSPKAQKHVDFEAAGISDATFLAAKDLLLRFC